MKPEKKKAFGGRRCNLCGKLYQIVFYSSSIVQKSFECLTLSCFIMPALYNYTFCLLYILQIAKKTIGV
jgi:hypothetical protein